MKRSSPPKPSFSLADLQREKHASRLKAQREEEEKQARETIQKIQEQKIANRPEMIKYILGTLIPEMVEKAEAEVFSPVKVKSVIIPSRQTKTLLEQFTRKIKNLKTELQTLEKNKFLIQLQNYADQIINYRQDDPSIRHFVRENLKTQRKVNKKINALVDLILLYTDLYKENPTVLDIKPEKLKEELLGLIVEPLIHNVSKYAIFLRGWEEIPLLIETKDALNDLIVILNPIEEIKMQDVEGIEQQISGTRKESKSKLKSLMKMEAVKASLEPLIEPSPRREFKLSSKYGKSEVEIKKMETNEVLKHLKRFYNLMDEQEESDAKDVLDELLKEEEKLVTLKLLTAIQIKKFKKYLNYFDGRDKKKYLQAFAKYV